MINIKYNYFILLLCPVICSSLICVLFVHISVPVASLMFFFSASPVTASTLLNTFARDIFIDYFQYSLISSTFRSSGSTDHRCHG